MRTILEKAQQLHHKIIEETQSFKINGNNLLQAICQECINFKSLLLINNSHLNPITSPYNGEVNEPIEKQPFPSMYYHDHNPQKATKKTKIFLSQKHKRSNSLDGNNLPTAKAVKNNKMVYCHSDLSSKNTTDDHSQINQENITPILQSNPLDMTNSSHTNIERRRDRGSMYRGVSRNGNQWQVLIMINKKKKYIGSYSNEKEAAKSYDLVALRNHKKKAKTNFDYSEETKKDIMLGLYTGN